MRTLVTGGAGFIGSALVHELVARGEPVRVLDDFSTGRRSNLADLAGRVDLIEGDLCDSETVAAAVDGCEHVLHMGALPSVPRSVERPFDSHRANAEGTLVVLDAARRAGVRRVVYAASSSAYGRAQVPWVETMAPDPRSPYAAGKLAGEHYCRAFTACYGLETVALRFFNVFGPRQDPTSAYAAVIAAFVRAYLSGTPPRVYGDGTQSRDFCYIDNVVAAALAAREAPGAAGSVFNVGCGDQTSLLQILEILAELFGRRLEPDLLPPRAGDLPASRADIAAARAVLGYDPRVRVAEGLARTVEWYRPAGRA